MVVVVGETQPRPLEPLRGPTGTRLFGLAGRPDLQALSRRGELELSAEVRAVNLYDLDLEPADGGDRDDDETVARVVALAGFLDRVEPAPSSLLLLGRRVARELEVREDRHLLRLGRLEEGALWSALYQSRYRHLQVAVLPHPSGRNRWWNAEEHRSRARTFLRGVLPRPA